MATHCLGSFKFFFFKKIWQLITWKSTAREKDKTIIKSRWNLQKAMESIIFYYRHFLRGVALTDSRYNRKTPTFQLYGKPLGLPVRPSKLYLRACVTSSLIINYIFALTGRAWDCEQEQPPYSSLRTLRLIYSLVF